MANLNIHAELQKLHHERLLILEYSRVEEKIMPSEVAAAFLARSAQICIQITVLEKLIGK